MLGDSLIGRTAGFDPVSPGSSPGPPAIFLTKYIFGYMLRFFVFTLSLLTSIPLMASNDLESLGFSYQLTDISYAKKVALAGCNQMKEKNKILSDCKCEIILINNKFIGGR